MERKRELLLVSCKVEEEENEKPTPNPRWKSAPGWEGAFWTDSRSPEYLLTIHSVTPHSVDDSYRGPQSMDKRCREAKK